MRIRGTKPEFWRSKRIASVSWDARLVLKGLESYVDDNGVGKDDLALIVGDLFPRDLIREPSRTLARVSEAISEIQNAGLVWRYEGSGTNLLFVSFWEQVQRVDKPGKGRFPRPDGTMEYGDSEIRESVANPREPSRDLAPGTGEQGNRGTEEIPAETQASTSLAVVPDLVHSVEDEPRSKPVNVSAAKLARVYTSRVPLSDPGKIAAVVWNAIGSGYSQEDITRGLETLAAESRAVTADTLRIAIDGKAIPATPARPRRTIGREGW